jgi:hypothetical protein
LACLRRRLTRRGSQSEPFSTLATRSVGWRVNTPWTISEAIESWMARSATRTRPSTSWPVNASKVALPPQAAVKRS